MATPIVPQGGWRKLPGVLSPGQMRRLLLNETAVNAKSKLVPVLEYDGLPVTARKIASGLREYITGTDVAALVDGAAVEELSE